MIMAKATRESVLDICGKPGSLLFAPAYLGEKNTIVFSHNGASENYFYGYALTGDTLKKRDFDEVYKAEDFKFFHTYRYPGQIEETPFFIWKGVPYEFHTAVFNEGLFSCIKICPEGTYLCTCDTCGKKHIFRYPETMAMGDVERALSSQYCWYCAKGTTFINSALK